MCVNVDRQDESECKSVLAGNAMREDRKCPCRRGLGGYYCVAVQSTRDDYSRTAGEKCQGRSSVGFGEAVEEGEVLNQNKTSASFTTTTRSSSCLSFSSSLLGLSF